MGKLWGAFPIVCVLSLGVSGWAGGAPFFNLPWFLKDVVAVTQIGKTNFEEVRTMGPLEAEMHLRDRADPTSAWIMSSTEAGGAVTDLDCTAFILRDFSDWKRYNSQDVGSVPQWREVFHGVEVFADYISDFRGLKQVNLAAAVVSPGIPERAFEYAHPGAISPEFFDIAAQRRGTGFDRMHEGISSLEMRLLSHERCDGFELYIWDFLR